jgi:hypothetical protein
MKVSTMAFGIGFPERRWFWQVSLNLPLDFSHRIFTWTFTWTFTKITTLQKECRCQEKARTKNCAFHLHYTGTGVEHTAADQKVRDNFDP